jgi:hypothetical protein
MAGPDTWLSRRLLALRVMAPWAGLVLVPALLWVFLLGVVIREEAFAIDFHHAFWPAGREILFGRTPYPPVDSAQVDAGLAFLYPPFTALLLAVPALLPRVVADVLFTLVLVGCAVGTLRILGVRDWRCYAALSLWTPVFAALQTGNLSLLMTFGVAVVWHLRDRSRVVVGATAVMLAAKVFMWPLVVWLAATRRYAEAAASVALAAAFTLAGWLVVGFGEWDHFRAVVDRLSAREQPQSYTIYGLGRDLGVPAGAAHAATWAVGALLLVAVVRVARRGGARRALELTVGATLVLSPIVWVHYLTLLLVPLALKRPRFGPLWVAPALLWLCPQGDGMLWQKLLVLGVMAGMLAAPWTPRVRQRSARRSVATAPGAA